MLHFLLASEVDGLGFVDGDSSGHTWYLIFLPSGVSTSSKITCSLMFGPPVKVHGGKGHTLRKRYKIDLLIDC